jgi:O-antigen/teichoic acid export membrane protein
MKQFFHSAVVARKGWRATLANWLVVILGLGFTQGLMAVTLIVVARRVSFTEYGQYLACYGLLSLLVVLPNFGLDGWMLAGVPGILDVDAAWRNAFKLRLILLGIWLGVILLLTEFLPSGTFRRDIIIPTAFGLICDSLTLLSYSVWRVQNLHRRVSVFQIISSLILISVIFLLRLEPGQIVLFSWVRTAISAATLACVLARTVRSLKAGTESFSPKQVLEASYPFVLADVATSIYLKADLTIVSIFLGSTGAGIYGPALNLTNILFMIPNALYFIMVPLLSKYYQRVRQSFKRYGILQLVLQALSGMLLSIFVFEFAPMIVRMVFGPAYQASGIVFRWLSPILFIKSLNFGLGAVLTAGNNQTWRTTVQVVSAAFNLAANLAIVFPLGILGVVLVYILSELILLLGYSISTRKLFVSMVSLGPL